MNERETYILLVFDSIRFDFPPPLIIIFKQDRKYFAFGVGRLGMDEERMMMMVVIMMTMNQY